MEGGKDSESVAASWIARRAGDHWGHEDEVALDRWLRESTRNRVAFVRAKAGWESAARLKALSAGVQPGVLPDPGAWNFSPFFDGAPTAVSQPISPAVAAAPELSNDSAQPTADLPIKPKTPSRSYVRAIAASVLMMLAVAATWSFWPSGPSYRTPVGGLAFLPIADGSTVTLSTDSEVRVTLTETERRVNLERGEAFFEVAKDAARPFVVVAGGQRVIAVGTKFSVRRDAGDIRVVVAEGRVRVEDSDGRVAPSLQLAAGDIARAGAADTMVQAKPMSEVEESLSWRSGYLVFRDASLADAVAEFNRYTEHKIVIDDQTVAAMRVGGKFRTTNVGGFLRLLETGYPVRAEERDGMTVISLHERH